MSRHITAKQRSRLYVVQALYQWQVAGGDVVDLEFEFLNKKEGKISKQFFSDLFHGVTKNSSHFDDLIAKYVSRDIEEIGAVEKSILYLGMYELENSIKIPYKVVINECLNLAQDMAAEGAYKLINFALDKLAKDLRIFETK